MKSALLLILALLAVCSAGQAGVYDWQYYGGHRYAFTFDYNNWSGAQAEALLAGGNLVTINDAAENDWISQTFGYSFAPGYPGDPSHAAVWIGMYKDPTDAQWKWADGDPSAYRNWRPGTPGGYTGTHAYMHVVPHVAAPTWANNDAHDIYPAHYFKGVIESPVPEPSALLGSIAGLLGFGMALRRRKK